MALPDYSTQGGGSFFSGNNRNQQNQNRGNNNNRNNNRPPNGRMLPRQKNPKTQWDSGSLPFNPNPGGVATNTTPTAPTTPPATPANPSDFTMPQLPETPGPYTFGNNGLDNPFFDPGSTYVPQGSQGNTVNWWNSAGSPNPITPGNQYAEENPEAYYYYLLNQQGLGGLDAKSRAAQSMFSDFARGYQSAKGLNSELHWAQYANKQNIPNLIQLLSDDQLGIDRGQTSGGPINWTLRG